MLFSTRGFEGEMLPSSSVNHECHPREAASTLLWSLGGYHAVARILGTSGTQKKELRRAWRGIGLERRDLLLLACFLTQILAGRREFLGEGVLFSTEQIGVAGPVSFSLRLCRGWWNYLWGGSVSGIEELELFGI